jgi:hypothetical protein
MLTSFTEAHKFYVSVTQIEYVKEKESVEIVMRIFIEDLEKLLRERYDKNITLNASKSEKQIDSYIENYVAKKVLIKVNNNPLDFKFLGKEYEDDIVFCYLEIEDVSEIKDFEISNTLFFEVFKEQQNIIKTNINTEMESFVLTSQKNKAEVHF